MKRGRKQEIEGKNSEDERGSRKEEGGNGQVGKRKTSSWGQGGVRKKNTTSISKPSIRIWGGEYM